MSYEPLPQDAWPPWNWRNWLSGFWRYHEEEGTWTPEYSSDGTVPSSITYEAQNGLWIRKGRILHAWWRLGTDALTVGTGNLQLTGLPRASNAGFIIYGTLQSTNFVGADTSYNSARPHFVSIDDGAIVLQFNQADNTAVDATATYLATGANSNRTRGYIAYPVEI